VHIQLHYHKSKDLFKIKKMLKISPI